MFQGRKRKGVSEWEAAMLRYLIDVDEELVESERKIDQLQEQLMELESQLKAGNRMCAVCIVQHMKFVLYNIDDDSECTRL
jgi:hypothetical protein